MKRFLIVALSLNFSFLEAQVYHPFPTDSAEWSIDMQTQIQFGTGHYPVLYYMRGDTTINGTDYHKVFICYDSVPIPATAHYYLREQNKIIYFRNNNDTLERLLYDFNLGLNDTAWLCNSNCIPDSFVVSSKDSILTLTGYRNRLTLNSLSWGGGIYQMQWVEGIGDIVNGLIYPDVPWVDWWFVLLCFHEHDSLIWNFQSGPCWIVGINDNELTAAYPDYFPNPFSDYVGINYFLSKPGNVSAELLDATGKLLKKNMYRELNTGKHSIYFDTRELVPGIYLYRLKKDASVYIGKMIKMR